MDQFHVLIKGRPDIDIFCDQISAIGAYKRQCLAKVEQYIEDRKTKTNRDIIPMPAWDLYAIPAMQVSGVSISKPRSKNLTRNRAAAVAVTINSQAMALLAESDVYWDRIAQIEVDGESEVYDLTVEANHDFVVNDIVASNSIEQDADVVLFIYREEMYVEETERQNIADVIVSKHRNGPTGTVSLYFRKELTQFRDLEMKREEFE